MVKILIDNDIGKWAISEKYVSEKLSNLKEGEDIEITINSPGGSVYEGIAIFNVIRKAVETHPVHVWINGLAASMASYIALAGRAFDRNLKITVNENTIFFIHNAWNYIWGDYRAMRKEADILDRITKVIALAYSAVSTMDMKDVRFAMDEETYYVGQEIIDAGFVNDFEALYTGEKTTDQSLDRDVLITNAQLKIESARENCKKYCTPDEMDKAVALLTDKNFLGVGRGAGNQAEGSEGTRAPSPQSNNKPGEKIDQLTPAGNQGGGVMDPQDLLAQHPDCYKKILELGEKAALEKERKRVNAHLKMGKESGDLDLAAKFIQEGKSVQDDEVHADYMAAAMKNQNLKARMADNPNAVSTGGQDDADEAEIIKSFDLGFSGKNLKGEN